MHRKALSPYDTSRTDTELFNDAQLKTVLVFLSVICIYFLQYRFRILDDNTLLSWRWIATEETFLYLLLPLVIGLVLVYKCCQMQVTEAMSITTLVLTAFLISFTSFSFSCELIRSPTFLSTSLFTICNIFIIPTPYLLRGSSWRY